MSAVLCNTIKNLAGVHDVQWLECALDGAHLVHRAIAGLRHQEVHLVQAHAVLAGAGAFKRQCAATMSLGGAASGADRQRAANCNLLLNAVDK